MDKSLQIYGGTLSFTEKEHAYQFDGVFVPGVTSVLKILDKPALVQWSANMAVEFIRAELVPGGTGALSDESLEALFKSAKTAHRRASKSAADIGSQVHAFAEAFLETGRAELPEDPQARNGALAFRDWHERHSVEPIHVERMVFSKHWWFAGQTDFVGVIDGKFGLLDFKSSAGLYIEYLLQLGGYAVAWEEETGERVNDGWVARLDKKSGKPTVYHIPLTDQIKDGFLRVKEAHELLGKIEETLDGVRKSAA